MGLQSNPNVPHKGWKLKNVIDLQDEGLSLGNYESCEFCNQEQIRFVHILSHPNYPYDIRVGCICAERLTNDYINPKRQEQRLRSRANRRKRWLSRNWKYSKKGNLYLAFKDRNTHESHCVGIMPRDIRGDCRFYKVWIDDEMGKLEYPTQELAQFRIFDVLEKRNNP